MVNRPKEGLVKVTCRITHVLGHYEETALSAAKDESGGKNSIQAIGSAVTYLQRYTLLSLLGLATKEQDNDGKGAAESLNNAQIKTITDLLSSKSVDKDKFLKYMECESIEKIPASSFSKAVKALNAAKSKQEAVYINANQKKMLEAIIHELNIDRSLAKEYFFLHKECDVDEKGAPTLNKLHLPAFNKLTEDKAGFKKKFDEWMSKRG